MLVLHGIDVKRLESHRQEAVLDQMSRLRDDLEQLVTREIDWNANGPAPVRHPRLKEWLEQLRQAAGGSLPAAPLPARRYRWLAAGGVVLLAAAGFAGFQLFGGRDHTQENGKPLSLPSRELDGPRTTGKGKRTTPATRDTLPRGNSVEREEDRQLQYLARWWFPSSQEAGRARRVLDFALESSDRKDLVFEEVLTRLHDRYKISSPARFFLPGLADGEVRAIERLTERRGEPLRPQDVASTRRRLNDLAGKIESASRQSRVIEPLRVLISEDPEKEPACRALSRLFRLLQGKGCDGLAPETSETFLLEAPLFDGRDARIARLVLDLRECFEQLKQTTSTTRPQDALLQARRYLPDRTSQSVKAALKHFCGSVPLLELVKAL